MKGSAKLRMTGIPVVAAISLALAFVAGRHIPRPVREDSGKAEAHLATNTPRARSREALREVVADGNAASRTLAVLDKLDACRSREDFLGAIEAIESTADKSEKNRYLAAVFSAWLETDPLAAVGEVRRVESLRHNPTRVAEAFSKWAEANPLFAADLLARVLDGRQNDPSARPPFLDGVDPPVFLLSMVAGLGRSDPRLAADTLARSAASPVRTASMEILFQSWYPADAEAVQTWTAAIQEPETRRIAVAAAATKAGQADSTETGISWAMALADPGDRQAALRALTGQWSQRQSADAFAWTRSLSDEALKLSLMPGVIRQFAIIDPGGAADWLNQYDASPEMDASIAAYAKAIQHVNPSAALASAAAITDPELREDVSNRISKNQSNGTIDIK